MRGIAYVAATLALLSAPAAAQPAGDVGATAPVEEPAAPPQAIGYGAMPGGLHAPSAETLPKGAVEVFTLGGFGWRSGLLGDNHRFGRGLGDLAVAFGATPILTIGLSLDGRYDKHFGLAPSGDDGYVGDPHLMLRVAKASGNLRFGGQLGVWVPGKDAPSIAGSAISVDARGLVSLKAGPGLLSFSAGFRLDNSAKSADPEKLSLQDRVSLGVSEFHAVLGGVNLMIPSGKLWFDVEGSIDVFVGKGDTPMGATAAHSAPGPLIRFGASAGYHLTDQWSLLAFVEGSKVPSIDAADIAANDVKLIAYEPMITGGLGLSGRFGGPKKGATGDITHHDPIDIAVVETADVSGQVVDDTGKPLAGATVEVVAKTSTGKGATDDKGQFTIQKLPIGKTEKGATTIDGAVEVKVSLEGKKPASTTLTLVKGENTVPKITLEAVTPPGQLRGVVRTSGTGKPLAGATITIEPGGVKATSGADGTFEVDLQPGTYKIKATAPGLATQELDVTIDPNGVAIKNIELHK